MEPKEADVIQMIDITGLPRGDAVRYLKVSK